ncbi:MAG: hypothetical protein FVQ80_07080 [Planctomycetes bacterium]|nr:hypothetical protein [Planctomycetota bacterium]
MIFQHRDGELRVYSGSTPASKATAPFYIEVLFVNAGFDGPIARTKPTETLVMDRGNYDGNAEYRRGMDEELMEPLPLSWTCKLSDDVTTQYLVDMLSSASPAEVNSHSLRSSKGESAIGITGVSTPQFSDSTKMAWDVEVLWDGSSDIGYRWREVHFPGGDLRISEGEDEVVLNISGLVYGDVTRIASLSSGTTIQL